MANYICDLADDVNLTDAAPFIVAAFFAATVNVASGTTLGLAFDAPVSDVSVTDATTDEKYLLLSDVIQLGEGTSYRFSTNEILVDEIEASDVAVTAQRPADFADVVNASTVLDGTNRFDLTDSVHVGDAFTAAGTHQVSAADVVNASDALKKGLGETAADVINAGDAHTKHATATTDLADSAQASDGNTNANDPAAPDAADVIRASDAYTLQASTTADLADTVEAYDAVLYHDPAAKAWVMNTETTAASIFTNYDFTSVAQLGGNIVMAGPDGLYLVGGTSDAGSPIAARVQTGFTQFGDEHPKRVTDVYVGYTADGDLALTVETAGATPGVHTYQLQARNASAPRASRVIMPRGLVSRYWRFTWTNVSGADFNFNVSMGEVSIAPSKRRL